MTESSLRAEFCKGSATHARYRSARASTALSNTSTPGAV
jgi:hypothetical protein